MDCGKTFRKRKMHWVIQNNIYSEEGFDTLIGLIWVDYLLP